MAIGRLTQTQIDGIKAFAESMDTSNMNNFVRALKYYRPIMGHEEQPAEDKNPWHVKWANHMTTVMREAGITKDERTNQPDAVEAKLKRWIASVGDSSKLETLFDAIGFVIAMTEVRTADIDLSETIPQPPEPIYGETKADELGLPDDIKLTEVEDALAS